MIARSFGGGITGINFISAAHDNVAGTAITAGAIPEPGITLLLAIRASGLVAFRRRRSDAGRGALLTFAGEPKG